MPEPVLQPAPVSTSQRRPGGSRARRASAASCRTGDGDGGGAMAVMAAQHSGPARPMQKHRVALRAGAQRRQWPDAPRSEEHTSELQSPCNLVCRLLLEKKKII